MTANRHASTMLLATVLCLVIGIAVLPASSAERIPSLRLVAGDDHITASRFPGDPIPLQLGTFVAAVGGPFELRAARRGGEIHLRQVVPDGAGVRTVRTLPRDTLPNLDKGLPGFFVLTVADASGHEVARRRAPFCVPSYERSRVDDSGPDTLTYPMTGCFSTGLARTAVWGIERGWGVSGPQSVEVRLPDGTYTVTVAIAARYVKLFDVPPKAATTALQLSVTTDETPPCEDPGEPCEPPNGLGAHDSDDHASRTTPVVATSARGLPDLVALPAHRIFAERDQESGRDTLIFAATVWNEGPGALVVEGFRRPGTDVMDAFQYLYDNGKRVGRHDAGTLEYDRRDGHGHWHFTDFARYRLVDADREAVVRSGKEAFCLAPTDAIDLTLPTAHWRPGSTGLATACGVEDSIWIREVLDVGWGDTYVQSVPGQSFDITDVDNGTYLIEVKTNPDGDLRERRRDNNVSYTKVVLGGTLGARTVEVQPQS